MTIGSRRSLLILAAAFAILLAAGCSQTPDKAAASRVPDDLRAAFASRLDSLATAAGIPGASAAFILPDGGLASFAWGLADSVGAKPMTTSSRMISGSVGKTWFAATVVKLALGGEIDLDAPLATYLGDEPWFSHLPNSGDLTLRRLMNHASGMPDHLEQPAFLSDLRGMLACGNPDTVFSHEDLIGYVLDLEPLHPAGGLFRYTDTNYILSGLAVEAAAGRAYDQMLRENLTAAIGLDSTAPTSSRYLEGMACGHVSDDNPFGLPTRTLGDDGFLNHNPALEWTGGGVVTTPTDLARWTRMLWSGELLGEAGMEDLLRGCLLDPDDPAKGSYGLAVFMDAGEHGRRFSHGGWYPGYHTLAAYWPDRDVTLAVQINRDHDSQLREIHAALADLLLKTDPGPS